jgi:hypothetical protein
MTLAEYYKSELYLTRKRKMLEAIKNGDRKPTRSNK